MRWRYSGEERVYTHIPVTVADGDVVEWPEPPADDGHWAKVEDGEAFTIKAPDNAAPADGGEGGPGEMIGTSSDASPTLSAVVEDSEPAHPEE